MIKSQKTAEACTINLCHFSGGADTSLHLPDHLVSHRLESYLNYDGNPLDIDIGDHVFIDKTQRLLYYKLTDVADAETAYEVLPLSPRDYQLITGEQPPVMVLITQAPNPFSWTVAEVGNQFFCEWFPIWGCYRVIAHKGRHPDDQIIRPQNCIALISQSVSNL
jgi:hypothetical protein